MILIENHFSSLFDPVQVDVNGWLEAFAAHPQIGQSPSETHKSPTSAQFCFSLLFTLLYFQYSYAVFLCIF